MDDFQTPTMDPAPYVLPDGTRLTRFQLHEVDGETYRSARFSPREGAYLKEQARLDARDE